MADKHKASLNTEVEGKWHKKYDIFVHNPFYSKLNPVQLPVL